jgi:hypothetical protein
MKLSFSLAVPFLRWLVAGLTAKARVRVQVNPCRICDGQSGTGRGFSPMFSPVNVITPWLSMLIYHLEDEQ